MLSLRRFILFSVGERCLVVCTISSLATESCVCTCPPRFLSCIGLLGIQSARTAVGYITCVTVSHFEYIAPLST